MKLVSRKINGGGEGSVEMICENVDDLVHVYNIVRVGDVFGAPSQRRITKTYRVHCDFVIKITEVGAMDTTTGELTMGGLIWVNNQFCGKNHHHTINLKVDQKFSLCKEFWDALDIKRLDECLGLTNRHPDVAVLLAQQGVSSLCLISSSMTVWKPTIRQSIPHKRKGFVALHELAMTKFIDKITKEFMRCVDMKKVKRVIIASDYMLRVRIFDALITAGEQNANNAVKEEKNKILLTLASSGHPHSITEVLSDPTIRAQLEGCKFQNEFEIFRAFYETLSAKPHRAVYGLTHVLFVSEFIDTLIVSDSMLRRCKPELRLALVGIIQRIQQSGGKVHVFSSLHVGGEQLDLLHGIAAVLTQSIPAIDEIPMSDEEED